MSASHGSTSQPSTIVEDNRKLQQYVTDDEPERPRQPRQQQQQPSEA